MAAKRTTASRRLSEVYKSMFGNGKPEESVLVRIKNIERKMCNLEKLSWVILCGVGAVAIKAIGAWFGSFEG